MKENRRKEKIRQKVNTLNEAELKKKQLFIDQIKRDAHVSPERQITLNFFMGGNYEHRLTHLAAAFLPEFSLAQIGGLNRNPGQVRQTLDMILELIGREVTLGKNAHVSAPANNIGGRISFVDSLKLPLQILRRLCFIGPQSDTENYNRLFTRLAGLMRFGFGFVGLIFRTLSIPSVAFHRYAMEGFLESLGIREAPPMSFMGSSIGATQNFLGHPLSIIWFGILLAVYLVVFMPIKMVCESIAYTASYTGNLLASFLESAGNAIYGDGDNFEITIKRFFSSLSKLIPVILALALLATPITPAAIAFIGSLAAGFPFLLPLVLGGMAFFTQFWSVGVQFIEQKLTNAYVAPWEGLVNKKLKEIPLHVMAGEPPVVRAWMAELGPPQLVSEAEEEKKNTTEAPGVGGHPSTLYGLQKDERRASLSPQFPEVLSIEGSLQV